MAVHEASAYWPVDEMGPEKVVFLRLPHGCAATVVVDSVALGTAIGGVRMTPAVDAAEVARLARAMTVKNAVAHLPHGGGKAGISAGSGLSRQEREQVLRAFAVAIRDLTDYVPGPDMGTDETAMAWVRDEIGRAVGLPSALGGIPLDELGATGFGLAVCAEALADEGLVQLAGARVAVQGFGAVGRHAALRLAERGAVVVAVSDSQGATFRPDGLDVGELVAFKRSAAVGGFPGGTGIARDEVLWLDCDILVPAAQPDVVAKEDVDRVHAGVILQGANIPVTAEAEHLLHRRGVLVVPDVLANAGGVICASVELRGGSPAQAFAAIEDKIRAGATELAARLRADACEPRQAVLAMAVERLNQARSYRRRF